MKNDVFVLSTARTPIGSFGGSLSGVQASSLGAVAVREALVRSNLTGDRVDELYMGNVISANLGQAPARQVSVYAGLPSHVTCTTVNKVCASGMKALSFGAQSIQLGDAEIVVAGGMESMSQVPFYLPKARNGYGYGHGEILDGLLKDGLTDVYDQVGMGVCGDRTALKYGISREDQDAFAIQSYQRSASSTASGCFADEIVGVEVPGSKGQGPLFIEEDEEFKKVKFDKIPLLKPVFSPQGTVTAANASTINDGAAALVLCGQDTLDIEGVRPIGRIVAYADAEQEPQWFTTTPILAARKVLKKAGLSLNDIEYFEINEAFAVVALVFIRELGLDVSKVNLFGGAVSLGHPLGASGARIVTTLFSVLKQQKGRYGMAAICNGGGGATAVIVEKF